MLPFDAARRCPKCGAPAITVYHENDRPCTRNDPWADEKPEHLHRYCQRCQYDWREAPLDTSGPDPHQEREAS